MLSTNKLIRYTRSQTKLKNGRFPGVRALNALTRHQVERERILIQQLTADADARRSQMGSPWAPADPLAVWADLEQFREITTVASEDLKPWRDVGQHLKLHLLLRAALIFGGYSFTARVRPDLQAKWLKNDSSPSERIFKIVSNGLSELGLKNLPLSYVIEGTSRKGYGKVSLHIHGIVQTDNPHAATALKVMLEEKLSCHPKGRAAAGISPRSGKEVLLEPIYEAGKPDEGTAGRWATYITKNALRDDKRLRGRRIFATKEGTALAREFWSFLRGDE